MRAARRARRGLTLLELLVALTIGSVLLLGASALVERSTDAATRVATQARAADRAANAERVLRAWVREAEPGADAATRFAGDIRSVAFGSWCDTPNGWREPCHVQFVIAEMDGGWALRSFARRDTLVLLRATTPLRFLYLVDPRRGGEWRQSWRAENTTPHAIGVAGAGDTIVLAVGDRG